MTSAEEQLLELRRGAVDLLLESDLRRKLDRGRPLVVKTGFRSDRAGPASRAHRAHKQDAAIPAVRPRRRVPDRRFHRPDRRSHRAQRDAPAADAGGDPRKRADLRDTDLQDPRSRADPGRVQFDLDGPDDRRRADPARGAAHRGAHARARRLLQPVPRRPADRDPRVPVSAGAGLRLGRAQGRRRARAAPTRNSTCWSAASSRRPTARSRRSC